MYQDILNFSVYLYSYDGVNSDVIEFLNELIDENSVIAKKAISAISNLPYKIYTNTDIKPMKVENAKFSELRVQSGSNICRFFFSIERPNVIVLYGFTKKTQKTDRKDINNGIKAYKNYLLNKQIIKFDIL